ncbi:hypothetical protein AMECASPLE_036574 [Ameca splendens]|uniref:Uncharacterized protein n=1 Tax=Ameca splendens TaxID=208324 RepID=A0ABV0Y7J2_9TELE
MRLTLLSRTPEKTLPGRLKSVTPLYSTVPLFEWGTTTLVCQSSGTAPYVHAMLQNSVNQHNPTTSGALRNYGLILSTPRALSLRSFLITLVTSAPEIGEPGPGSPGSASSVEDMLVGLRRFSKYSGYRPTTYRVEVNSTPSPPETPYGGPELPRSHTAVVFHSLSELLPHQSLCLSNHPSHMPLGLPVPISCFWSSTGQKNPIGLLVQPVGIPHRRCPPACSRIAAMTGTNNLATTAPVSRLGNGGTEHGPLGLNVPHLPRNVL